MQTLKVTDSQSYLATHTAQRLYGYFICQVQRSYRPM